MLKPLRLLLYVTASFSNHLVSAQHENTNWIFGHQSGLQFNNQTSITTIKSSIRQLEGSASISDAKTGKLLFYSDGLSVWNQLHQPMPNGTSLLGSPTSTQSALIVPYPDHPQQYYLFTIKSAQEPHKPGLHYSVVDLSLAQGLGAVTEKNILIDSYTTEKLTAIPHANGHDYWIIAHTYDSNEFLVYLLTGKGISSSQRINIGSRHLAGELSSSEAMGYLKASPNGKMLAAAVYGKNRPFELFDFDSASGAITNERSLGNFSGQYGVSFSPDNTKLYLAGLYSYHGSFQFDLLQPSYPSIPITFKAVVQRDSVERFLSGSLQLGPDGNLYASTFLPVSKDNSKIAVIRKPNKLLNQDSFSWVVLPGALPNIGLPNFLQSSFNEPKGISADSKNAPVVVFPNPVFDQSLTLFASSPDLITNITIMDIQGKSFRLPDLQLLSDRYIVNTTLLPAGQIYLLSYSYQNQRFTQRISKL